MLTKFFIRLRNACTLSLTFKIYIYIYMFESLLQFVFSLQALQTKMHGKYRFIQVTEDKSANVVLCNGRAIIKSEKDIGPADFKVQFMTFFLPFKLPFNLTLSALEALICLCSLCWMGVFNHAAKKTRLQCLELIISICT